LTEISSYFSAKPSIPQSLVQQFFASMMEIYNIINAENEDSRKKVDNDLTEAGITIYRFREGIERFFITDINNPAASAMAQSSISVISDNISSNPTDEQHFNHLPGGANVLYMDGHVEFLKYPNVWPASPLCAALIGSF